jgi:hypothetical protein
MQRLRTNYHGNQNAFLDHRISASPLPFNHEHTIRCHDETSNSQEKDPTITDSINTKTKTDK